MLVYYMPEALNKFSFIRALNNARCSSSVRCGSPARLYEDFPLTGTESLAKDYFPVTMSAYKIDHMEPPLSRYIFYNVAVYNTRRDGK